MALSSVAALSNSAIEIQTPAVTIKQERPDEAEIREMAAKMVEENKAKMANARPSGSLHQGSLQLMQPGQPGILNYLTRGSGNQTKTANDIDKKGTSDPEKKPPCDEDSQRGRFGWMTLGKCHIPFIFRLGEKYCAVRMVEMKLLNKYLSYLHSDIYNCTCIRSYYITEHEARLLNEVNIRHCEGQFGREAFTSKDLVVRLQDAGEFYSFLDVCYNKLLLSSNNPKDKCGFIRINGESVVPYTVRDGLKYVPLFYFEGETDNLKLKAEKLEGWDLAYLKFCCKVQGIRNELFASETCSVISLNDIKSYFPPGTVFEDYWPSKVVDSQLLLATKGAIMGAGMWTKQPKVPPPQHPTTISTTHHPVTSVNKIVTTLSQGANHAPSSMLPTVNLNNAVQAVCNGWTGLVGGQPTYQPGMVPQPGQVIRMTQAPIAMHNLSPTTNSARNYNPVSVARPRLGHQYYPQVPVSLPTIAMATAQPSHMTMAQQLPPLVRATVAPPTLGYPTYGKDDWSASTYTSSTGLSLPSVSSSPYHMMGLTDPAPHHQMLPPPPHAGALHYAGQQRHTPPSNSSPSAGAKFPPPLIPVVNGSASARYSGVFNVAGSDVIDLSSPPQSPHHSVVGNGRSIANEVAVQKLIQIVDFTASGNHIPFQVQKALVDNKMVPCINWKPFIYSDLLMTLPDLVSHFFPTVGLSSCKKVLQDVLGLDLYQGNRLQMTILRDSGKCQTVSEVLPLVQLRDVMQYMPQMKYMFSRMSAEDNPAKRQRTS